MEFQDNALFLREAKEALHQLNEVKNSQSRLDMEQKKLDKTLKDEKKAVNDQVKFTIKKRQDELNASFDAEIAKLNEKIKKENLERDKAIAQGKKKRTKDETAELHSEIQSIQKQIKDLFRNEGVPGYANTTLFYSIFSPQGLKDYLILAAAVAVCFILFPFVLYKILPVEGTVALVVIYILCILLFGGLFIFLRERTTMTHPGAIKMARGYRSMIQEKRKEIRSIEEGIARDEDMSFYDLSQFDGALTELQNKLAQTMDQKQAAMDNFERVTRRDIIEEIRMNSQGKIDELEASLERTTRDLRMAEEDVSAMNLDFPQKYGTYIDKDFLQESKLDKLIEILDNGEASSITEAQNVFKMR